MTISERVVSPDMIALCILKNIKEIRWIRSHCVNYISRHIWDRSFNTQTLVGRYRTLRVAKQRSGHLKTAQYALPSSPALLPGKEVRASTTMGVVHSIKMALVGGQWESSHLGAGWRYCCVCRSKMCIVSFSVWPLICVATESRRNPQETLQQENTTEILTKSLSLPYQIAVKTCSEFPT